MNLHKIAIILGVLLSIVVAFVEVPYSSAILLVIGLIAGWHIIAEQHVRVLVSALVLSGLAGTFNSIPNVGGHLAAIFGAFGVVAAGAALMIIGRNVYDRVKP
jgi:hypothetical protein